MFVKVVVERLKTIEVVKGVMMSIMMSPKYGGSIA